METDMGRLLFMREGYGRGEGATRNKSGGSKFAISLRGGGRGLYIEKMESKMDLDRILAGWDFSAEKPVARMVSTERGPKVQLRVDMGVLQMEPDGRPDGEKPHGYESMLAMLDDLEKKGTLGNRFEGNTGMEVQREISQYYSRMNAWMALDRTDRVFRDCEHVLDLLDWVSDLEEDDDTAWRVNQIYPYVRTAHAQAAMRLAVDGGRFSRARRVLEQAIEDIRTYYRESYGDEGEDAWKEKEPPEVEALLESLESLEGERPQTAEENLKKELDEALANQNYEVAAKLRDRLRALRGEGRPPSQKGGKPRAKPENGGGAG